MTPYQLLNALNGMTRGQFVSLCAEFELDAVAPLDHTVRRVLVYWCTSQGQYDHLRARVEQLMDRESDYT